MICCRLIDQTEEFEALAPAWAELFARDPNATPFQSPEWLLPWWRHFGQPVLRTVVIEEGETLLGLLPAYVYAGLDADAPDRQLLLLGAGTSDYGDGLWSPQCPDQAIDQALRLVLAAGGWDRVYLAQLRLGSRLSAALARAGWACGAGEACSRLPAVPIAALPQKIRMNYRNSLHRAERAGSLAFEMVGLEGFDELLRLHTARWESRGEPGVLSDAAVVAWHREALPGLLAAGLARIWRLSLSGETLAMLYTLTDPPNRPERTEYFYLIGFEAAHAAVSPGTLIVGAAIDRASRDGFATVDFLRGGERYKQFWRALPAETESWELRRLMPAP